MADYANLPHRNEQGRFHVVVESPRGSLVKLKYEPDLGTFQFQRPLLLGASYPYDWGFVPSTRAPDGDPLDGLVLFDAPTWPGVVIPCVALGVIRLVQKEDGEKTRNDRIIAVPADDPRYQDVKELPMRVQAELERFFINASQLTAKTVEVEGWESAKFAEKLVDRAAEAHAAHMLERANKKRIRTSAPAPAKNAKASSVRVRR